MLIIDCHAHILSPDEKRYQPKMKPLRPPGGPHSSIEDLRRTSQAAGVKAVRAIQTVSFYGHDNRYLCDSTKVNRRAGWMKGVCTLDPDDPHSPGASCNNMHANTVFRLYAVSPPRNPLASTIPACGRCGRWRQTKA